MDISKPKVYDTQVKFRDSTFQQILARISEYSIAMQPSYEYWMRNRSASKAAKDDIQGKMGECITREFFYKAGVDPSLIGEIDWEIRKGSQKSWVPDLLVDNKRVHVKTTGRDTAEKFALSWTFQWANRSNAGGRDKLFSDGGEEDVVALVYNSSYEPLENGSYVLKAILPWQIVNLEEHWRDPIKESLKGLKRILYWETVEEIVKDFDLTQTI